MPHCCRRSPVSSRARPVNHYYRDWRRAAAARRWNGRRVAGVSRHEADIGKMIQRARQPVIADIKEGDGEPDTLISSSSISAAASIEINRRKRAIFGPIIRGHSASIMLMTPVPMRRERTYSA